MGVWVRSVLVGALGGLLVVAGGGVLLFTALSPRPVDAAQVVGAVVAVVVAVAGGCAVLWRWGRPGYANRRAVIAGLTVSSREGVCRRLREAGLVHLGVREPRDGFRSARAQLPYARRRVLDAELERALASARFVLVHGPSAAGKSRSTAEAARQVMGERRVLIPVVRPDALRTLLAEGAVRKGMVVWLSDLEQHVAAGVDAAVLERVLDIDRVSIVATIRAGEYQRIAPTGELRAPGRDVVELAIRCGGMVEFAGWDQTERDHAAGQYTSEWPDVADALNKGMGLGEYLIAGPELVERLELGQPPAAGVAVVRAAADWYRAGLARLAPVHLVRRLFPAYLPPDDATLLTKFDQAVDWACTPTSGARLVTRPTDGSGLVVHDYLLDHWTRHPPAPIPDTTWDAIADELDDSDNPDDAATAAIAAHSVHHNPAAAERLARRSAAKGSVQGKSALGAILAISGRSEEAEPWCRAAAKAGYAPAMYNLGVLLDERGDLAEAERWYRTAAGADNADAMYNLGMLLKERGDLAEAGRWWRTAAEAGDLRAMTHLGILLAERGDLARAERCWRAAAEVGDGHAMFSLGLLLQRRGDLAGAEHWYRAAAEAGDVYAMANLGVLLEHRGDSAEAERWYRTGAEAGHGHAMANLGVLLHERGERAEAERWYRIAAEAGYAPAMFNLGVLLHERGERVEAERWYRAAAKENQMLSHNDSVRATHTPTRPAASPRDSGRR